MRNLGLFLKDAWRLAIPYFRSEERWSARGLLAAIIVLNLSMVGMDVIFNFWNGRFYDALQDKNWRTFINLLLFYQRTEKGGIMPGFIGLAAVYILVAVYRTYLNQWLQIRWRRWMTERFLNEWLGDRVYYRISLMHDPAYKGTENPDQRIAEDLRGFVGDTLSLSLDLLSNVVSLFSFIGILWSLSGPLPIFGFTIPGYMVWVALVYAALGTFFTHLVGRPLAALNFLQQRFEADFRFALVRLRENVEGVALYSGEKEEHASILIRFTNVVQNWWNIMQRTKLLNALVAGYSQLAVVFPIIVAAPRYFSGVIPLGGLTRTVNAFGQVQSAMSWFVNSYASLAALFATVERLATFHRAIVAARALSGQGVQVEWHDAPTLELHDVTLAIPSGKELLSHQSLRLEPRVPVLVTGRSGSGKSTLFRAIAGIWPFGSGSVERPRARFLFLPQRPYLPLGTLRHAITYPAASEDFDDATVEQVLRDVGLAYLVERLLEETNWSQALSGGEQQRVALARALLLKPDWLFLDEATASLDPDSEAELYGLLRERLPATTIVSISHQPAMARFHQRHLVLKEAESRLVEAEPKPAVSHAAAQ